MNINNPFSIPEIQQKIARTLLGQYVSDNLQTMQIMQSNITNQFLNFHPKNLSQYIHLIDQLKFQIDKVESIQEGVKDYLADLELSHVFHIFKAGFNIFRSIYHFLSSGVGMFQGRRMDNMKKQIQMVKINMVIARNEQQSKVDQFTSEQKKQLQKQIEMLDYSTTIEQLREYQYYSNAVQKILFQRDLIKDIQPSEAPRYISQANDVIENVIDNASKIFLDSIKLQQLESKTLVGRVIDPDKIQQIFIENINKDIKKKLKKGIMRGIQKLMALHKKTKVEGQKDNCTQTDQQPIFRQSVINTKNPPTDKNQDKLHNLLIIERQNNGRLTKELEKAKKNEPVSVDQKLYYRKRIDEQILRKKETQSKYELLQKLYHEKNYQFQSLQQNYTCLSTENSNSKMNSAVQATPLTKNIQIQTCKDFFLYCENQLIFELQNKNEQLNKHIHHLEYVIKQMEAIKNFRNNFKSKKEIMDTCVKISDAGNSIKSMAFMDIDNDENIKEDLLEEMEFNTKREVTFKVIEKQSQMIFPKKKSLKKIKQKITISQKIADITARKDQSRNNTSQSQQQISVKSILKLGNQKLKQNKETQTQPFEHYQADQITKRNNKKTFSNKYQHSRLFSSNTLSTLKNNKQNSKKKESQEPKTPEKSEMEVIKQKRRKQSRQILRNAKNQNTGGNFQSFNISLTNQKGPDRLRRDIFPMNSHRVKSSKFKQQVTPTQIDFLQTFSSSNEKTERNFRSKNMMLKKTTMTDNK